MPQDEIRSGRAGTRKISKLAKRDFTDLDLVRRRVQDAMLGAGAQGLFVVLEPIQATFILGVVTRICNECELER